MIVIAMAGRSRRFKEAGYAAPKYRLLLQGRPVFDYAIASFRAQFERESFLFALGDDPEGKAFVQERARALGIGEPQIVCLGRETAGQAETVALALEAAAVPNDSPVTVFNIDTFRPGFDMRADEREAAGFLEVFHDHGANWSFVQPDPADAGADAGRAIRVLEKEPVSDLCSTGLYYFRERRHFDQAYQAELRSPSQSLPEHYIAPIYNQMIAGGLDVRFRVVDKESVIFCGTPAEYEALLMSPETLRELALPPI